MLLTPFGVVLHASLRDETAQHALNAAGSPKNVGQKIFFLKKKIKPNKCRYIFVHLHSMLAHEPSPSGRAWLKIVHPAARGGGGDVGVDGFIDGGGDAGGTPVDPQPGSWSTIERSSHFP